MLRESSVMYNELIKEANKHFTPEEVILIKKAYLVAEDLHRGQKRKSGEPYIIHPLSVAYILLVEAPIYDANVIVASLLHDSIEDTGITKEYLAKLFNDDVANLVEGVTNVSDTKISFKKAQDQYDVKQVLQHILRDFRIALIKCADRLHNMRTLEYTKPEKQRYKAAETLSVYCPIALHIGANYLKDALIDLSFQYLCASRGNTILSAEESNYMRTRQIRFDFIEKSQNAIESFESELNNYLESHGHKCRIRGKAKGTFGIYQRLAKYGSISNIPNLISFEIETESPEACYQILELLKSKYNIIPKYYKDYIAHPDPNGYQAIHVSAENIFDMPCRIKIFSKSMAQVNKYGIAALYNRKPDISIENLQADLTTSNKFLKALKENYQFSDNPFDYIGKTVRALVEDTITVYDGTGKPHTLPNYSTVYDFACDIDHGLSEGVIGATVNGLLVDPEFPIRSGDRIDILKNSKSESQHIRMLENLQN